MFTQDAAQQVTMGTMGSLGLVWTLVTRSIGLTAGLAIALLLLSALISTP